MKNATRNTIVGLTALAGLAALVWLTFMFGEIPDWTADDYRIHVEINDANGLTSGSRVKLSGIDIGRVESVRFNEQPTSGVQITCKIQSRYEIPANAEASAESSLLGGVGQLTIHPERTETDDIAATDDYLPKDGSGRLSGEATSMTRQVQQITKDLGEDLQVQLKNFGRMSDAVVQLADRYTTVGDRLEEMMEERSIEDVETGRAAANISTILARTDATLSEMNAAAANINKIAGDEQLHEDLRQTLSNTRGLTDDARQVIGDAGEQVDRLTRRYIAAADDLSKAVGSLDGMLTEARNGEGTLGKMMQDPALYESLTDTAQRLSEAVREAKLLIQKWKAEGLPVQF